jgi:hypothetical protein
VQRAFFSSGDISAWHFGTQYNKDINNRFFFNGEFNVAYGTSGHYGKMDENSKNYTFITIEGFYPFDDFVPGEPFDQGIINLKGRTGRDFYANFELGAGIKLLASKHHEISVQAALGIGYIDRSYIAMEVDGTFSSYLGDTPMRLVVPFYYSLIDMEHLYRFQYQYVSDTGFVIGARGIWHLYFGAGWIYSGGILLGKKF